MSKVLAPLEWHNEHRKVSELVPYNYNPRKITEARLERLKKSLTKFNLAEIPAINTDNVIVAGHQRIKVLMALGRGNDIIDVRVPNRTLTEEEYKEYNITSNVSVGYWDVDILEEIFADIDLMALGLDIDNIELPADIIPDECIDTYELHEILIALGYAPVKKSIQKTKNASTNKKTVGFTQKKSDNPKIKASNINFYWCLKEREL